VKPINLSESLKAHQHATKIQKEKDEASLERTREAPLTAEQVTAIEALIQSNDFETPIPLAIDFHRRCLFGIWMAIIASKDASFSPVDAFSLCLNSLLGEQEKTVRTLTKMYVLESIAAQDKFIIDGLKNIGYYRDSYNAVVFSRVNMLRDVDDELISLECLKTLGGIKLTEALIESAVRFEDLEAINYCLRHLVKPYERNDVLRKCLRIKGVSKVFTDIALCEHTSVDGFAKDVITVVKTGSIPQLERVYNPVMAGKCYHELIIELMSDSYLTAEGIRAAQHFVGLVIESGFDVYPTFVSRYFGTFAAIDQMAKPRLTPGQMLDMIYARQHINSASSLDAFLPSFSPDDIRKHPNSGQLFDRLHTVTKKPSHLKYTSNLHKGQHLSEDLGM